MNNKVGIIFDLDGVLVKTDHYHYLAWKKLADSLKIHFDHKVNNQLRGISRMESLDIVLKGQDISKEKKLELANQKNEYYKELLKDITPTELLPGVIKFLDELKANNVKMAVGSSSKNARTILNKLSLSHYFDTIIDGTDLEKSKPNPEVFLKAAMGLNLDNERCIVFEDASAGVQAGINAGMKVVGVGPGKNEKGISLGIEGIHSVDIADIKALAYEA